MSLCFLELRKLGWLHVALSPNPLTGASLAEKLSGRAPPIPTQAASGLSQKAHSKALGGQVASEPCMRSPATPSMKRLPVASPGLTFQVPADELRGNLHPKIHPRQPWEERGCCNNTF